MTVIFMVDSMPSRIIFQFSRRWTAASPIAPTTPMAPASVGVARPKKIVPSTIKINASEGTTPMATFFNSASPRRVRASGGRGGML